MTYEEEFLEILHVLICSGISPGEAKEKTPNELAGIHAMIGNYR